MTDTYRKRPCELCPWREESGDGGATAVAGAGPEVFQREPVADPEARFALAKIVLVSFTIVALVCLGGVMAGRLPEGIVLPLLAIFAGAVAAIGYNYFKFDPR